jgi:hypothetical protein
MDAVKSMISDAKKSARMKKINPSALDGAAGSETKSNFDARRFATGVPGFLVPIPFTTVVVVRTLDWLRVLGRSVDLQDESRGVFGQIHPVTLDPNCVKLNLTLVLFA